MADVLCKLLVLGRIKTNPRHLVDGFVGQLVGPNVNFDQRTARCSQFSIQLVAVIIALSDDPASTWVRMSMTIYDNRLDALTSE